MFIVYLPLTDIPEIKMVLPSKILWCVICTLFITASAQFDVFSEPPTEGKNVKNHQSIGL